jgi:hypothetical protein
MENTQKGIFHPKLFWRHPSLNLTLFEAMLKVRWN